jgi:hypothetical protein
MRIILRDVLAVDGNECLEHGRSARCSSREQGRGIFHSRRLLGAT